MNNQESHYDQVMRLSDEKWRALRAANDYIAALDWAASDGGAWGIDRAEATRRVEETLAELRHVVADLCQD